MKYIRFNPDTKLIDRVSVKLRGDIVAAIAEIEAEGITLKSFDEVRKYFVSTEEDAEKFSLQSDGFVEQIFRDLGYGIEG